MATSIVRRDGNARLQKQAERGFSLLEVLISMVVLTVGLVSLLGVFGLAMAATQTSQQDMIAKQLANEALESIVTARNTSQINWDDIQNVGSINCPSSPSPCGIFLSGANPIFLPATTGANAGIVGTSNHLGLQTLREPGPDGNYGDADDVMLPLTNYQRTIAITELNPPVATLRSVNIIVQYATSQNRQKTYVLNSYISQYP